jgi:spermidine synthase
VTYRSVFGDFYNLRHNNRIILASNGPLPAFATIQQNSGPFAAPFAALGFAADEQLRSFSTAVDWNPQARVLTDQYSPANLLNSSP